jgi:hypothetical protein
MKVICSWCGTTISEGGGAGVSHGICQDCHRSTRTRDPEPIRRFVSKLEIPVLMVDGAGRTGYSNEAARHLVGKQEEMIEGSLVGGVFECVHASQPGGCGGTEHCSRCTFRSCIEKTYATGLPLYDVPATLKIVQNGTGKEISCKITTMKADKLLRGKPAVLLSVKEFSVS